MRKLAAELIGTFMLVFAGTGAIVVNGASGGVIGHAGIALTFGLMVMALIYALGGISGAHFNPAVTAGFWLAGRFPGKSAGPYAAAQAAGAVLASFMLRAMFPDSATLGETLPVGPPWRSCVLEAIMTAFLMLVILRVTSGSKEEGLWAGVAIGGTIAVDALFGGPISGASMNPARSFGPALVSGNFRDFWVYLAGPLAGAGAAVALEAMLREPGQTGAPGPAPEGSA